MDDDRTMTREEIVDIQRKVLSKIEIECKNELMPALFSLADDQFPYDVLNLIVYDIGERAEQCKGDFCFMDIDEMNDIQSFAAIITVAEDISLEHYAETLDAINSLNYYIPYGAFAVNKSDKELVLKLSCPLSTQISEEYLYDQVQLFISNLYMVLDQYIDLLLDVVEGRSTPDVIHEITGE